MHATDWASLFRTALEAAQEQRNTPAWVAFGFTNCVDTRVRLDSATRDVLSSLHVSEPRQLVSITTPEDLACSLLYFMGKGIGGEVRIAGVDMAKWMAEYFEGPLQLGGTGAQGAETLARLGFHTLLHVTSLSVREAKLYDNFGCLLIATRRGFKVPLEAAQANAVAMNNFIFDYGTGDTLLVGDLQVTAPRANRVIVSYGPLNAALPIDPLFCGAVADPELPVTRLLISGYTEVVNLETLRVRIASTRSEIGRWRSSRPALFIHLELGSTDADCFRVILDDLAPHTNSLGLNEDELNMVMGAWGHPLPDTPEGQIRALATLLARTGIERVGLHTEDFCVTLTTGDPVQERKALLFASLVAGTRARLARFPTMKDVYSGMSGIGVSDDFLTLEASLTEAFGIHEGVGQYDGIAVVVTPTLHTRYPATTLGLGDSFAASQLALALPLNHVA